MPNSDWAAIKISAMRRRNGKRIFLLFLFCVIQWHVYSQSCNCPPVNSCGACVGGVVDFTFRYNGAPAVTISASDNSGLLYLKLLVPTGETFSVQGSLTNGMFLGSQLKLSINGFLNYTFDTSCGLPLAVNSDYGSFTLLAVESLMGGTLCCPSSIVDNVAPSISNCPANIQVSVGPSSCSASVNWTVPTVTDNCSNVSITTTHTPGDSFNKGTSTVRYTATDEQGNSSTCSFNVTVVDDVDPVFAGCPSNIVVSANASCQATVSWTAPTVSDNCAGTVALTSTKSPGSVFPLGTTPVTYTATDPAGNISICSFNVTVQDNTNPVIVGCPSNIIVNASAACEATVTWTPPTASDNCSGTVTLMSTKTPGSIFPLGTTPVTYTATDAKGNTSTCSFNVTVQDNTSPVITSCPSNIVVNANASCQATVSWTPPTVSDNCPGTITLTTTKSPGSIFSLGTTAVTYTAKDAKGNTSTCSFNVTVQDNTNPVINGCPSNIVVNANTSCQASVTWTPPTASDNCTGVTLTSTKNPGTSFPLGTTTVTYTARDAAGRSASCSFTVTVQDNTKPVISGCPSNLMVNADASCQASVSWIEPTASDNCGTVSLVSFKTPGAIFPLGTTAVTYTATDAAGNISTCSFNVVVADVAAPVFTEFSDIQVTAGQASAVAVTWEEPTTIDCSSITMVSSHRPGDLFSIGTTQISYTATDSKGQSSSLKFNITVKDKTAPVFSACPQGIVQDVEGTCALPVSWSEPTASDNSGEVTVTKSHTPGYVFPSGTTVVKYTATDPSGNVSVCEFAVTINNKLPPTFTQCPEAIHVKSNENGEAIVDWIAPEATAACSDVVVTASHAPGSIFPVGSTVVHYVAEDAFGNKAYCNFDVVVTQQEIDIQISKVITPDGNGENDTWIVKNIEKFKDNKIVIVDRWGSVIYTASGYNNGNVVWTGSNQSGAMVPVGTYFYTVSVRYGKTSLEKSGFIELIR